MGLKPVTENDISRCVKCKEYFIEELEGANEVCDKCRDAERDGWQEGELAL